MFPVLSDEGSYFNLSWQVSVVNNVVILYGWTINQCTVLYTCYNCFMLKTNAIEKTTSNWKHNTNKLNHWPYLAEHITNRGQLLNFNPPYKYWSCSTSALGTTTNRFTKCWSTGVLRLGEGWGGGGGGREVAMLRIDITITSIMDQSMCDRLNTSVESWEDMHYIERLR